MKIDAVGEDDVVSNECCFAPAQRPHLRGGGRLDQGCLV